GVEQAGVKALHRRHSLSMIASGGFDPVSKESILMHGVLISVELPRHLREHCVWDIANVPGILQLHDDYIPAALHSFGIVTGRVRVSRNNEPCVFQNLVV